MGGALRSAASAEGLSDRGDRDPAVLLLLQEVREHPAYDRGFASRLLHRARGGEGDAWEVRCLAALMLQAQALRIPVRDLGEYGFLFQSLGIEGYPGADPRDFVRRFRRRIGRAAPLLSRLRGEATPTAVWRDVIRLSRSECRLPLARYLFTPEEVVARVRGLVKVSRGLDSPSAIEPACVLSEAGLALSRLPPFEAEIVRRLCEPPAVYWVSERTPAGPHALVERPPGTVVLVVKPPGSDLEIEIKRCGLLEERPLRLVFRRNGAAVPVPHRLQGGSMLRSLHWDAGSAAVLSRIYRLVHGREAPISRTLSIKSIYSIPSGDRLWHTLDYFTEPDAFGEGFARMRAAMAEVVKAFTREDGDSIAQSIGHLPGDLGLTLLFTSQAAPGQAILAGTSAFRLDRLARYLSGRGDGEPAWPETREAADGILEEVLGAYVPPESRHRGHQSYVRAAFAVPANRAAADRAWRDAMRDLGTLWGTLLAIRGYSRGESFVGRNMGLKSAWTGSRWRVGLVSMDHDALRVDTGRDGDFRPLKALRGMEADERFILGPWSDGRAGRGSVGFLQDLYHVSEEGGEKGRSLLRRELRRAYRKTHAALAHVPGLKEHFCPSFVERIGDWDTVVRARLRALGNGSGSSWQARMRSFLAGRGYTPELLEEHLEAAGRYAPLLSRQAFLYGVRGVLPLKRGEASP